MLIYKQSYITYTKKKKKILKQGAILDQKQIQFNKKYFFLKQNNIFFSYKIENWINVKMIWGWLVWSQISSSIPSQLLSNLMKLGLDSTLLDFQWNKYKLCKETTGLYHSSLTDT